MAFIWSRLNLKPVCSRKHRQNNAEHLVFFFLHLPQVFCICNKLLFSSGCCGYPATVVTWFALAALPMARNPPLFESAESILRLLSCATLEPTCQRQRRPADLLRVFQDRVSSFCYPMFNAQIVPHKGAVTNSTSFHAWSNQRGNPEMQHDTPIIRFHTTS